MRVKLCGAAALTAMVLAGCGGGGGGTSEPAPGANTSTTASGTVPVAITTATAKPIAANATEAAQGGVSTQNVLGALGVQIEASDAGVSPQVLWVVGAAQSLAQSLIKPAAVLGVAVSESGACSAGGTVSLQGNVASQASISPGDTLTLTATGCRQTVGGVTNTMNGTVTLRFDSYSESPAGVQGSLVLTANELSVQTSAGTVVTTGSQTVNVNSTATSTQLVLSGDRVTTRTTTSAGTRTTTWKNFKHTFGISSDSATASVSGAVESDSPKLGANGGSYTVSTPTSLSWNLATGAMSRGALQVMGASNSQMLITYSSAGAVITIDTNGDGIFESTVNASAAELKSAL